MQSPSSINTYKQCPRKYYYKYNLSLPTKTNIHQLRGKIAHAVLEDFFDIEPSTLTFENVERTLKNRIQELFIAHWQLNQEGMASFGLAEDQVKFYSSETIVMLFNWLNQFLQKLKTQSTPSCEEAFKLLTPIREEEYSSIPLSVHGFIDAIEYTEGKACIMDYKTSTELEITEEQRLQLAIYSLLYKEKHGEPPHKAGIYFLRFKPKFIAVDNTLIEEAHKEIELVHQKTQSDTITDYPLKTSGLCKWCDFYTMCFEQKSIKEYLLNTQTKEQEQALQKPPHFPKENLSPHHDCHETSVLDVQLQTHTH